MYRIVRDSNGKVSLKPCPMVGCESLFRYEPYKERDTSQMPSSLSRWIRTTNLGHEIRKTLESNRYWILVLDKSNWLVPEFKKLLDNPSAHYVDIDDKDNKIAIAYLKAKMPDAPVGVKEDMMKPAHQIAADALLFGCTPESVIEAAIKTPGGRIPEIPCAVCGHNPDQHEMSNSMPGQVEVGRCTVTGCSCRGFVKPQRVGEVTEARVPTDVEPLRKTKNFSVFPAKDGVRIVTRRGTRKSSVLSTKDWEYLQSLGDDSFDAAMVMDFGVGVNEASPADAILSGADPEKVVEATVNTKVGSIAVINAKDQKERDEIRETLKDEPGMGFSWTDGYDSSEKTFSLTGTSYHNPDEFKSQILAALKGKVTESMVRVDEAGGLGRSPELTALLSEVFDVKGPDGQGSYILIPKDKNKSQLKMVTMKVQQIQ